MLIKIIKGNYGYHNGVSVNVRTPADPPFSVSEDEALRLANLGVAEILKDEHSKQENERDLPPFDNGENCIDKENAESIGNEAEDNYEDHGDDEESGETDDVPEYGQENTIAELQAIASEWGIELPSRASKAQILDILDGHFGKAPKLLAKEPE